MEVVTPLARLVDDGTLPEAVGPTREVELKPVGYGTDDGHDDVPTPPPRLVVEGELPVPVGPTRELELEDVG
jgi:hypothetical protein